jgi:fructokinase
MILCCGEALIDLLPRTGPNGEQLFQPFPGGSVFNVAVALGRLGTPSGFFSGLSSDFFGATLREALQASGVDISLIHMSDRPTTLAFVTLADGQARYAFFDEGSAGRMLTENDLPALPVEITALHFGSLSLAEEPCGSAYEALMQRESRDRVISLDPNVRPSLIRNRDGYIARIGRLVEMADIVKLSVDDLDWLAPDALPRDFAAAWLQRGAKLVILTRGAEGAMAMTGSHAVSVPAVPVKVADTIGAGDTFSAGVLARLDALKLLDKAKIGSLSKAQLTDVLSFAAKAAAITASRPGADSPWLREIVS